MTSTRLDTLGASLERILGSALAIQPQRFGEITVEVSPVELLSVMHTLKTHEEFQFTQLSDLSGVDYLTFGEADWQTRSASTTGFSRGVNKGAVHGADHQDRRFAVVYQLLSVAKNVRLRVKVYAVGLPPRVASVAEIWPVADWYEREVFDLFGVLFDDHPDLRRILTDYGFIGHPFRKDFPLEGYVEVRYDPDKGRVVNQPVSIEPRTLVPRVIREDDWLHSSKPEVEPELPNDHA